MKQTCIMLACMALAYAGYAQTAKGSIMLGGSLLTGSTNPMASQPAYQQSVHVRIGAFAANNFTIGLCLEKGIHQNKVIPYSFTAFTRWYIGATEYKVAKLFVEAGAGIAHHTGLSATDVSTVGSNKAGLAIYISPGANLFMGRLVALELAPEYRVVTGATVAGRLGIRGGLNFHLSEQKLKKALPHTFIKSF